MFSTNYYLRANLWLIITIVLYAMVNGAGYWETFNVVPLLASDPPLSFHIFQGPYGLRYEKFWIIIHTVHEISFILAIWLNWKITKRRYLLFIAFGAHILLRIWTLLYFAPVLNGFWDYPVGTKIDIALQQQTESWKNWNLLRVFLYSTVNIGILAIFKFPKIEFLLSTSENTETN